MKYFAIDIDFIVLSEQLIGQNGHPVPPFQGGIVGNSYRHFLFFGPVGAEPVQQGLCHIFI